jgi:hypothetical protein
LVFVNNGHLLFVLRLLHLLLVVDLRGRFGFLRVIRHLAFLLLDPLKNVWLRHNLLSKRASLLHGPLAQLDLLFDEVMILYTYVLAHELSVILSVQILSFFLVERRVQHKPSNAVARRVHPVSCLDETWLNFLRVQECRNTNILTVSFGVRAIRVLVVVEATDRVTHIEAGYFAALIEETLCW